MPLDPARLGAAIHAKILSLMGVTAQDDAQLLSFSNAIAQAVVTEITGNAQVSTTGSDPQGGTVTSTGTVS